MSTVVASCMTQTSMTSLSSDHLDLRTAMVAAEVVAEIVAEAIGIVWIGPWTGITCSSAFGNLADAAEGLA